MGKRLTEKQKKEIIQSFKEGKTIDFLSLDFNCTKLTIIRNLKKNLGEENYQKLLNENKKLKNKDIYSEFEKNKKFNQLKGNEVPHHENSFNQSINEADFYPDSSFLEILPVDFEFENATRKEMSSVPISEIDLPKIVYMVVDKKIELEIKLLKDFPDWEFLPNDDLNRKTIEIHFDLKIAKRCCNKEQKVIKVPNTNIFKIAAPFLISKGISRIICADKLIAL